MPLLPPLHHASIKDLSKEQAFISWMIQNLCSEEIEALLAIFPLETCSELTIKAHKDNVSQLLRTTNKGAEPMRKVSAGDAAKIWVSLGRLLIACHLRSGRVPASKSQGAAWLQGTLDLAFPAGVPMDLRKLCPSLQLSSFCLKMENPVYP